MTALKVPLQSQTLHDTSSPSGPSPRVALAHGFTQNAACWGSFAAELHRRLPQSRMTAVDLPGHGDSGHDDVGLVEAGQLLVECVEPPTTVIGYSMGGRVALHAALAGSASIDRLVLIGTTAGMDEEDERRERRDADAELADRLLAEGLPAFLDRWLALPLFAALPAESAALEQRLRNRPEGLAATLRHRGTGSQQPLWHRLAELQMPVLVVAGGLDTKFVALGRRIVDDIGPNATFIAIENSGHATHLERPADTAAAIAEWLTRQAG